MAYANRVSRQQRGPILVAIGALHAGVIYALVAGLSPFVQPPIPDRPVTGEQIPLTPIPQPEEPETTRDQPEPQPASSHSARDITPPRANPFDKDVLGTFPTGPDFGPFDLFPPPEAPPSAGPKFTPKAATPRGSPGLWVTSDDYPANDIRLGHEGLARFSLAIGADGAIKECTIVATSGHEGLDKATCAKLMKRGKFRAATDGEGKAVAGSYSGAVRWKLPPNY